MNVIGRIARPFFRLLPALLLAWPGLWLSAQPRKFPLVPFEGGNLCPEGDWQLVFADEFNGDSLDRSKWLTWFPYAPNQSDQCAYCRTHGEEGQIYRDENAVVDSGLLKLVVKKEAGNWYGLAREYTSGMVHSRQAFTDYGRYEIRCWMPRGAGFWPAFWLFGWSTEIDVFEFGTGKPRRHYLGVIHDHHNMGYNYRGPDFSRGFHTFAVQYDPYFVHYEVDGKRIHTIARFYTAAGRPITDCNLLPGNYRENPAFPHPGDPIQIIANVAVGADHTPFTKSPKAKTPMPNHMDIDYIRVYQHSSPSTASPSTH